MINNQIRAKEVRLIDESGSQLGIVPIKDAINMAEERSLDLVALSDAAVPVCKIVNYGQFVYQKKKKDKQQSKVGSVVKQIKMSPKISKNDYDVRLNQGIVFLKRRYKIKLTVFFKGREVVHQNIGVDLMKRYLKDIASYGVAESDISFSGRMLIVIIQPKKGVVHEKEASRSESENTQISV